MRRGRRARRGARPDRQGLRGAEPGYAAGDELARELQDFVKANIAPYKYPRAIEFVRRAAAHRDRQAAALPAANASKGTAA